MPRPALLAAAILLAASARAEIISTDSTCGVPADLPRAELDTDATLNKVPLQEGSIYLYKDLELRPGIGAEIDLSQVARDAPVVPPTFARAPLTETSSSTGCE